MVCPDRLTILRRSFTGLLLALCSTAVVGEESLPVEAQDAGARMERIAEGTYVIIHDDATDEWPHGNTGVIVGDDSALVIDSTYLPSRARADVVLIRSLTDKPVRYLVTTHWHFDHNNGAIAYKEAYPGVAVVSERETRSFIDINSNYWSKMSSASGSSRRASLQELKDQLASGGADSDGIPGAAERARFERAVRLRESELAELATLEVVTPDLVFDGTLTLDLGGRTVELQDRGRANSPHDVTAYVADERVLFAGDILVQAPVPYFFASWPVPWIAVLRDIEQLPVTAVVPGHGPVMRDHAYARQVRALLEAVTRQVTNLAREGKTLDEVKKSIDVRDLRVAPWDEASDEDWELTLRILTERSWYGVRGQSG
jgi:glyoxylase-like metal-dependent hydrolase (beta-lactamase superfamily II)